MPVEAWARALRSDREKNKSIAGKARSYTF